MGKDFKWKEHVQKPEGEKEAELCLKFSEKGESEQMNEFDNAFSTSDP